MTSLSSICLKPQLHTESRVGFCMAGIYAESPCLPLGSSLAHLPPLHPVLEMVSGIILPCTLYPKRGIGAPFVWDGPLGLALSKFASHTPLSELWGLVLRYLTYIA